MPITRDEFRSALARFASGVTVVTAKGADGKDYGITVSAFCSVSLDPPLVLVCIENDAGSCRAVRESGFFVVNVLAEDQQHFSDRFASKLPDKFAGVEFREGFQGIAVLPGTLAALECRVRDAFNGGDHTIFVGEIEISGVADAGAPLVYFHGRYRKLEK